MTDSIIKSNNTLLPEIFPEKVDYAWGFALAGISCVMFVLLLLFKYTEVSWFHVLFGPPMIVANNAAFMNGENTAELFEKAKYSQLWPILLYVIISWNAFWGISLSLLAHAFRKKKFFTLIMILLTIIATVSLCDKFFYIYSGTTIGEFKGAAH